MIPHLSSPADKTVEKLHQAATPLCLLERRTSCFRRNRWHSTEICPNAVCMPRDRRRTMRILLRLVSIHHFCIDLSLVRSLLGCFCSGLPGWRSRWIRCMSPLGFAYSWLRCHVVCDVVRGLYLDCVHNSMKHILLNNMNTYEIISCRAREYQQIRILM
jgi:hypothetical protein